MGRYRERSVELDLPERSVELEPSAGLVVPAPQAVPELLALSVEPAEPLGLRGLPEPLVPRELPEPLVPREHWPTAGYTSGLRERLPALSVRRPRRPHTSVEA